MGRKIEVERTVNKDFNFAMQFLRPAKVVPMACAMPPIPYATEINVTQSFTGHGISVKFFP